MKMKTLAIAAGVGAPLILAGPASAEFLGIKIVKKTGFEQFADMVINVFAIFDGTNVNDRITQVGGTPLAPLAINVKNGEFYQQAGMFGTPLDTPTPSAAPPAFKADTYVGELLESLV